MKLLYASFSNFHYKARMYRITEVWNRRSRVRTMAMNRKIPGSIALSITITRVTNKKGQNEHDIKIQLWYWPLFKKSTIYEKRRDTVRNVAK